MVQTLKDKGFMDEKNKFKYSNNHIVKSIYFDDLVNTTKKT